MQRRRNFVGARKVIGKRHWQPSRRSAQSTKEWRRLTDLSPWRFVRAIWIIDLFSLVPVFAIMWLLDRHYHFFGPDVHGESLLEKWGALRLALIVVVVAPLVETFIGQGLPSLLTRLVRLPPGCLSCVLYRVVCIAPWIGLSRGGFLGNGPRTRDPGFSSCVYLSAREKTSRWRAIWMTASVHMLANLSVTVAYALSQLGVP